MKALKKVYYLWWSIAVIISGITILFQPIHLFDYLTKNYTISEQMKILKVEFDLSTSKEKSSTGIGKVDNKDVYFGLFDEDMSQLTEYINNLNIPVWEMEEKFNYDSMENLNLVVPVISFKHSKAVLLIPLGKTGKEVLNAWALSNLYMLLLAFLPLVILSFINKLNKKNEINN